MENNITPQAVKGTANLKGSITNKVHIGSELDGEVNLIVFLLKTHPARPTCKQQTIVPPTCYLYAELLHILSLVYFADIPLTAPFTSSQQYAYPSDA